MKEELLKGLTEEQITKIKACKSQEEVLALAREEGIELTDEQLEAVSGGSCYADCITRCPRCGANTSHETLDYDQDSHLYTCKCPACGNVFKYQRWG